MKNLMFLLVATSTVFLSGCDFKETKTDISTIRKHRISQVTDEQIHQMWKDAEKIRQTEITDLETKKSMKIQEAMKKSEICNDEVYKVRNNEECNKTENILMLQTEEPRSKEKIFDAILLGVCNFIDPKYFEKLRENNCIP